MRFSSSSFVIIGVAFGLIPCLGQEPISDSPRTKEPYAVLVVQISEAAISRLVDRQVTRTTPVDTCFQGTHVVGQAFTTGRPRIVLRDNDRQAAFEMVFSGTTTSRTTGYHSPVTLYGHSNTQFTASKRIEFQPGQGFRALPATVQLQTQNYLDNICTNRRGMIGRIVQRRAWGQAEASRPAALEFARSNAKTRILSAFDSLLEAKLADLNRAVEMRYFAEDFFGAKLPPIYQTSTHRGYVQLAIASTPGALVKVNLPPLEGERKPIQLWMHNSLLGSNVNIGLSMLQEAGREAESVLPGVSLVEPPPVLPAVEIVPGVKAPAPKSAKKEEVIWGSVQDWLVVQFEGDRVAERLRQQRAAAKAKSSVAQPAATPAKRP